MKKLPVGMIPVCMLSVVWSSCFLGAVQACDIDEAWCKCLRCLFFRYGIPILS